MDKRTMQFKLASYQVALEKAREKGDKRAIKDWIESIAVLRQEISQAI